MLRVLTTIRLGDKIVKRGAVLPDKAFSTSARDHLIAQGRLSPVSAPPVAVVTEFIPYAEALQAAGVHTVSDVLECEECDGVPLAELRAVAEGLIKPNCNHCGGE